MKVHTDLKKILLECFEAGMNYTKRKGHSLNPYEWIEENESRILALGKPEPLAKNKQTQKFKCNFCKDRGIIMVKPLTDEYLTTITECPECTKRADASSR